jgi:hypothetical protein
MPSRDPAPPGRPGDPADRSGAAEDPLAESISEELIGLDPDDPETRAFAEHLRRMRNDRPSYTVEGYLRGVAEFADSANRASGGRRLTAVVLVLLLLLVAGYLVASALGFVLSTWFAASPSHPGANRAVTAASGAEGRWSISVAA